MNKKIRAILCLLLSCLTVFGSLTVANAATGGGDAIAPRASDIFDSTRAWLTPLGGGKVVIEFDVSTTVTVKKVGVSSIVLWEKKQGESSYSIASIYTWNNTKNLTTTDSTGHYLKLPTFSGTPNAKYYATVAFYAETKEGVIETPSYTTGTITAT